MAGTDGELVKKKKKTNEPTWGDRMVQIAFGLFFAGNAYLLSEMRRPHDEGAWNDRYRYLSRVQRVPGKTAAYWRDCFVAVVKEGWVQHPIKHGVYLIFLGIWLGAQLSRGTTPHKESDAELKHDTATEAATSLSSSSSKDPDQDKFNPTHAGTPEVVVLQSYLLTSTMASTILRALAPRTRPPLTREEQRAVFQHMLLDQKRKIQPPNTAGGG